MCMACVRILASFPISCLLAMSAARPLIEAEQSEDPVGAEALPDAHEIIDKLFVGNADAAVEATTGPNSRGIGFILDVAGSVTPAIFAALASALAEEQSRSEDQEEAEQMPMSRPMRTEPYILNGIETMSIPLDDHGRTELSEEPQCP